MLIRKKCKTCMLTKITKQPFPNVVRKSNVLDLIHSDICIFIQHLQLEIKSTSLLLLVTTLGFAMCICYISKMKLSINLKYTKLR